MRQHLIRTLIVIVACVPCFGLVCAQGFTDFEFLPEYCHHTKGGAIKNPAAIRKFQKIFGNSFNDMHHYCRGLVAFHQAAQITDNKMLRNSKYKRASVEFNYVLDRSSKSFVLRPEILVKKGTALLAIERDIDAIRCFREAISARPDYVPAYVALSGYLHRIGAEAEARRVLEAGLTQSPNNEFLRRKLNELGRSAAGDEPDEPPS